MNPSEALQSSIRARNIGGYQAGIRTRQTGAPKREGVWDQGFADTACIATEHTSHGVEDGYWNHARTCTVGAWVRLLNLGDRAKARSGRVNSPIRRTPMYVCVCNAVTDREIRQCEALGAQTFEQVRECLGVSNACGRCEPVARQIRHRGRPSRWHDRPRLTAVLRPGL